MIEFQYWMLSKHGEIRRDEGCMDYAGQYVMIYPCHGMKGNQEWIYEKVKSSLDTEKLKVLPKFMDSEYIQEVE